METEERETIPIMSIYEDKAVLLVDDNKLLRKIIGKYLDDMGFGKVSSAGNATEALIFLKHNRVDLLLTDIHMPIVSGLTLLKTIRNTASLKQLPVLVISSEIELEYVKTALTLGISGYLVKPIQQDNLQKKIEAVFDDLQKKREAVFSVKEPTQDSQE